MHEHNLNRVIQIKNDQEEKDEKLRKQREDKIEQREKEHKIKKKEFEKKELELEEKAVLLEIAIRVNELNIASTLSFTKTALFNFVISLARRPPIT